MDLDLLQIILSTALVSLWIVQMIYWWVYLAKPYYKQKKLSSLAEEDDSKLPPVSVILCVQNEEENIEKHLVPILEQDYPKFEVIVVDNHSWDDTVDVLKRLKQTYKHLYFTFVPDGTRNISRKKLGVTLGVKAAQYSTLLFTEPDSYPQGNRWIRSMVNDVPHESFVVLGFSALEQNKGLVNKYMALDYFYSNIQSLSMALQGKSYGANGRNMLYNKMHFENKKGFSKHRFLEVGEDDLFVNEIVEKKNIIAKVSKEALVFSKWEGRGVWNKWKSNRALTKHFYPSKYKLFWRIESFSRILFLSLMVYCIAAYFSSIILPSVALGLYLIRTFSQQFVVNKTAKKLNLKGFSLILPIYDILQPFVNFYFYIGRILRGKKDYTWKLS